MSDVLPHLSFSVSPDGKIIAGELRQRIVAGAVDRARGWVPAMAGVAAAAA